MMKFEEARARAQFLTQKHLRDIAIANNYYNTALSELRDECPHDEWSRSAASASIYCTACGQFATIQQRNAYNEGKNNEHIPQK